MRPGAAGFTESVVLRTAWKCTMEFQCPLCRSNIFRLLTLADGASAAQCLSCGEASSFSVATMLDCSGRARLAETVPFRPDYPFDHRPGRRKQTGA